MTRHTETTWPDLPLARWKDTYAGLHMWLQVIGKTRLALAPPENHWWHIALYVTPRGLTTSAMPSGARTVSVTMDFIDHVLCIDCSDGARAGFALEAMSVADFFHRYRAALASLGVEIAMHATPVEVAVAIPFAEDTIVRPYDAAAAHDCWRVLRATDVVMKRFRGSFQGKQSPSHFFWGSFDIATTRFSGRPAPTHPGGAPNCPDYVMVEAYSHECSSCGFWPGGGAVDAPAFYAYSYPKPAGYESSDVAPGAAYYDLAAGEFILPYAAVRNAADPEAMLMEFFESTYAAAADRAKWDRAALDRDDTVVA